MRRVFSVLAGILALFGGQQWLGAEPSEAPDFKEVYDLIHEHLGGMTDADMNRAAVQGLVTALSPRVALITNGPGGDATTMMPLVLKSNLFDGDIAYVRIGRVAEGLAQAVRTACDAMGASNKLKGVVLDLRYASGDDYAAAGATADLFLKKEQVLLKWGSGTARSTEKKDALAVPVAALVNRQTVAGAEALAAVVRQAGIGLILGGRTAGKAMAAKEYPLKNGSSLRIATAQVEVGETATISADGLKPDILVEVKPDDERAYYADAFRVISSPPLASNNSLAVTNQGGTNRTVRRNRLNEAELVRERRDGGLLEDAGSDRDNEPEKPVVHDPALARALDLLKGLAVVRHS